MVDRFVSHYKVLRKIGEGGMGEVYLAEDTTLDRQVALKFLAEDVRSDHQAQRRLLREAKSAAALDHPFICKIYEIGQSNSQHFIAMEYIGGQNLKEILDSGPLAVGHALRLAVEVAQALEHAQTRRILHRDLKPANLMIALDGHVKVMDFGLAKRSAHSEGETTILTGTELTQAGAMVGTIGYMSPEQLSGKLLDHRSDFFALGIVLFESITGVHPFRAATAMETASAILEKDPPPLARYVDSPPVLLAHILKKLLCKDPDRRYQLARELLTDLESVSLDEPEAFPESKDQKPAAFFLPWVLTAGLAVALGLVWWDNTTPERPISPPVARTTVFLPENQQLVISAASSAIALSPDGKRVVYAALIDGTPELYLRNLDQYDVTPLPGTQGARHPFFSPNGEWVGFFANGRLQRVSVLGGLPLTICETQSIRGAAWSPDGRIIFAAAARDAGLWRVQAKGGRPEKLSTDDPEIDRSSCAWPSLMPSGRELLTTIDHGTPNSRLAVLSLATGKWHVIGPGSHPRYVPPGYLVYYESRGGLQAIQFDARTFETTGLPVSVLESVYRAPSEGAPYFEISTTGTLVYLSGGLERTLVWVDQKGNISAVSEEQRGFRFPHLSPDEKQLVLSIDPRPSELWLYDLERGTRVRLTAAGQNGLPAGASSLMPYWTPDNERIIFSAAGGNLYSILANGSEDAKLLVASDFRKYGPAVSPNGEFLAYQEENPETSADLWVLSLTKEGSEPEPFLVTPSFEVLPAFSPDGRWLAYNSDLTGQSEVYVRAFPGPGPAIPISIGGGHSAIWSADGRELYYRKDQALMAVEIELTPTFRAGAPKQLFSGRYTETASDFDVTADGRFLMIKPDPTAVADRLNIVQNWAGELQRLVK